MITLTRPEGTRAQDLNLSRRALGAAVLGGYAVYALSAHADPIITDTDGLVAETVAIPAADGFIPGYLARPDAPGRHPAILVVSEVFGVHEYIRDICRRLAKLGYVAIAPDLFVRSGDPSTTADFAEIQRIVAAASEEQTMGDIASTLKFLKKQKYVDRRSLAITGYCWGGAVVWMAAAKFPEFRAGAAWYGRLSAPAAGEFLGEPERHWPLSYAGSVKVPVLGLYGGKDAGIPMSDAEAMRQALIDARRTDSEIVVYPQAQHGFHADYRSSYDAQAAQDGWNRMLAFFAAHKVAPRQG
jgi:carboxymethylenebutenolidase